VSTFEDEMENYKSTKRLKLNNTKFFSYYLGHRHCCFDIWTCS